MRVRWTNRAASDLLAIGDHIATDKPGAARAWVERLRERTALIAEAPRAGRVVPETNSDIGYISKDGCDFQLALSGDTGTLADGPVTCSTIASDGSTLLLSIDSYTATCADGHNLTIVALTDSGATCNVTLNGSGTR